jgi:hypothetical protein
MKSIQFLLSDLFVVGTLLWARTAVQRRIESDFREWRSRSARKNDRA